MLKHKPHCIWHNDGEVRCTCGKPPRPANPPGRKISRVEALRIAKRTLLRAEAARKPPRSMKPRCAWCGHDPLLKKSRTPKLEKVYCPASVLMVHKADCVCLGTGYLYRWADAARKSGT